MTNTNSARLRRNLRKGKQPRYLRDEDFTRQLIASYGNKRTRKVKERVAATQDLRRSNAATAIPSRKTRREQSRSGGIQAAVRRSREEN